MFFWQISFYYNFKDYSQHICILIRVIEKQTKMIPEKYSFADKENT